MVSTSQHELATIDVSPLLSDISSKESKDSVLEALRFACTTDGFFQVTGHGIPVELQLQVLECAKRFFDLPMEQKQSISLTNALGMAYRGYEQMGGQATEVGGPPDLKEGFIVGSEIPSTDPRAGTFLLGPNQWPSALAREEFEQPLMQYLKNMVMLFEVLLQAIASTVPSYFSEEWLQEIMTDAETSLRLLHYPPQDPGVKNQYGAGAHADLSCLTILLQEHNVRGLQVWSDSDEEWFPAPAVQDAFVVNVGNLLQTWSGGHLKSARHRVINEGFQHRYSVPVFYQGNLNAEFTASEITKNALPTQGQKGVTLGKKTTVANYILDVLSAVDTSKD